LPIRFSEHNAFANCHFASAKWQGTAFAYHSPQANALALPFAEANGKWRMIGECSGFAISPKQNGKWYYDI
jgi:hypothetical protein